MYYGVELPPGGGDSTGRVVGLQVVGQDDSQQLQPDRVVFLVAIGATEALINETVEETIIIMLYVIIMLLRSIRNYSLMLN